MDIADRTIIISTSKINGVDISSIKSSDDVTAK